MKTLKTFVTALLVVVAVALIGSYTFLPWALEGMAAKNLRQNLELSARPGVTLVSEPPPKMLIGEFARGEIEMKGADFGGMKPDRVTVDLAPFEVNVVESAKSGAVKVRKPLSGTLRVELSEKRVAEIAREKVKDFPIEGVDLTKDQATVSSEVQIIGLPVPVSIDGRVFVRNDVLVFKSQEVRAMGVRVPKRLADALLAGTDFTYRIEGLPYDTRIKDVQVEEGRVVLTGDVRGITLGGSGG